MIYAQTRNLKVPQRLSIHIAARAVDVLKAPDPKQAPGPDGRPTKANRTPGHPHASTTPGRSSGDVRDSPTPRGLSTGQGSVGRSTSGTEIPGDGAAAGGDGIGSAVATFARADQGVVAAFDYLELEQSNYPSDQGLWKLLLPVVRVGHLLPSLEIHRVPLVEVGPPG